MRLCDDNLFIPSNDNFKLINLKTTTGKPGVAQMLLIHYEPRELAELRDEFFITTRFYRIPGENP